MGERLFDRMKREAKLAAHGEAFLPRALRILEEVDLARREASDARSLLRGRLIVGVLQRFSLCCRRFWVTLRNDFQV